MRNYYETPGMEVICLLTEDVIATSGESGIGDGGAGDGGNTPF